MSTHGIQCWNGFSKKSWQGWGPVAKLALPGVVMIEVKVLATRILTFVSSYFGTTTLAAQSVLATITSLTSLIPFPLSIAAPTRGVNLICATLADAARVSIKIAFVAAFFIGILNVTLLSALRPYIPRLFTKTRT